MPPKIIVFANLSLQDEHGNVLDPNLQSTWNDATEITATLSATDFHRLPPRGQQCLITLFRRMAVELERAALGEWDDV